MLSAIRCSTLLSWNGVSSGCFERTSVQMPGDVRCREAVAGRADRLAARPGELDVDAAREELDRRVRVVVEALRVGLGVAADGDDRREAPRVALDRHVVRRRDEDRPVEVGLVGELVQHLGELALRRREAHVDDVEALLHGPAQAAEQDRPGAGVAGAEHADAVDLAVRRERADDARARGAVTGDVTQLVGARDRIAVVVDGDLDRALQLADSSDGPARRRCRARTRARPCPSRPRAPTRA